MLSLSRASLQRGPASPGVLACAWLLKDGFALAGPDPRTSVAALNQDLLEVSVRKLCSEDWMSPEPAWLRCIRRFWHSSLLRAAHDVDHQAAVPAA